MTDDNDDKLLGDGDIRTALDNMAFLFGNDDLDTASEKLKTPELQMPAGWKLQMTSIACPEQYSLLDAAGEMRAYFRLRGGSYSVECPDVFGDLVYSRHWDGEDNMWKGGFDSQEERQEELQKGIDAVLFYETDEWQPLEDYYYRCADCRWHIYREDGAWHHQESEYAPENAASHEPRFVKGSHGL